MRPLRLAALLVVAAALAIAVGQAPRPLESVLLISIDSLRADRLGAYGNARATSPTLDRLAREGVLFERTYSPTSWTLPAHATLLSGRLPHHHGTVAWQDSMPTSLPLLQESFGRRGHETFGIYSGPFLHPHFGFARGFDRYVSCMSYELDTSDPRLLGVLKSHDDRTNEAVEKALAEWIDRRADGSRPFFAFVHMWDVHFDYIAPEPYATMFDPGYDGVLDGRRIIEKVGFPIDASPRDVEHLIALYDGELRYTDDTIGRMLGALDRAGMLERTLVVVTADHGEEFLEHGGKTHHRTAYVESVHVPLILWAKRGLPRGVRVGEPVSLADVPPTIAEILAVDPPPGADGRSLVPAVRGRPMAPRPVLSAMYIPGREYSRMLAVRETDRTAVLWMRHHQWQRFDPHNDPLEQRPEPLPEGPERAALEAFDAEVMALLASRAGPPRPPARADADGLRPGAKGDAHDATNGRDEVESQPPAAITQRLRVLGYVH
jgi:arylsulfatase A-like enzyme